MQLVASTRSAFNLPFTFSVVPFFCSFSGVTCLLLLVDIRAGTCNVRQLCSGLSEASRDAAPLAAIAIYVANNMMLQAATQAANAASLVAICLLSFCESCVPSPPPASARFYATFCRRYVMCYVLHVLC